MADPHFVGRAGIVAQILGDVGGPGRTGMFFDVDGIPGIGKTELLDQLAKLTGPEDVVARINGSDFEARGSRARTATSDDDAEFRQLRRLLLETVKNLPDDNEQKIPDLVDALTPHTPSGQQVLGADSAPDPDDLVEQAIEAANSLDKTLAATQARFLVLVDDFHLLAGRPLGQWVMTWLAGIRGADVVVAHEDFRGADDPGLPTGAVRLPLGNLSRADVEAYLKSYPDIGPDVAGIVNHVWDFTGGYPRALVLVADLIKGSGSRDSVVQLIEQLAALQGGRAAQLKALVNRILDAIREKDLSDTLYKVCVTRHFDGPLIELLMDADESRAQTLIDGLTHYSFVRKSTGEHPFYAVSDFVRRIGEEKLGAAQTQVTHSEAAKYYEGLLVEAMDEDEDEDSTSYQSWFRYEKPTFQALERDWLYHVSRLTGTNRRASRIGIARIFLDAFWWWGSYIPFPFCEQILVDWADATLGDDEDRAWGAQLRILYDSFPKGWRYAGTPADQWRTVRLALRYLWHQGRMDQARLDDPEMRHIRGILDFYLADAESYVDPGNQEVDERLDDAAEQFARNDDEWNTAWVEFYRADLTAARGQADLAISMTTESAERHPDLDDDELLANLHRVCADAQWRRQDPGAALDAHARAVLHAYRFQVKGVQDAYTDAFQQEMIDRSTDRLAAWHDGDRDSEHAALRSACARIRAFFGPYWREVGATPPGDAGLDAVRALDEGRLADVAELLFPARPTLPGSHDSPYALTCVDVTHKMRREVAELPGTPLPPAGT
jgi:hypothetical protein